MSVDYGAELVYGFKLNRNKIEEFKTFAEEIYSDFNIYDWMEEECGELHGEFVYENHYVSIGDSDIYFGIIYCGVINASNLAEFEADYFETVADELIGIFGNFDILDETQSPTPEFHVVAQIY
jgi:hypothetical protein